MSDGPPTYAATRPVPYLLALVASQTVTCPVRYGSEGALVAPTSGTITVTRPDGTALTPTTVTIVSSVATCTLPSMAAEVASEGWGVVWSLTISGVVYVYRYEAFACTYVPSCPISVQDLIGGDGEPDLRTRIPDAQAASPRGDGTGWQPQIDSAYYALIQWLIEEGHRPWLMRGMQGIRKAVLADALRRCCNAIARTPEDVWGVKRREYYGAHKAALGTLKVSYDGDTPGTRRGPSAYRLAPAGRPSW